MKSKLIRDLERQLISKAFLVSRSITECYNHFPKHDANALCTAAIWKLFLKYELMIPWNIIVQDNNTRLNRKNYVVDNYNIEVVFMFRLSPTDVIQCSLDAWTPELLIEYKKLIKGKWEIVEDNYSSNLAAVSSLETPLLDSVRYSSQPRLMWQ